MRLARSMLRHHPDQLWPQNLMRSSNRSKTIEQSLDTNIIDMWSRYTLSIFIDRKKPSHVIDFNDTLDRKIWSYGGINDGQWQRIQLG